MYFRWYSLNRWTSERKKTDAELQKFPCLINIRWMNSKSSSCLRHYPTGWCLPLPSLWPSWVEAQFLFLSHSMLCQSTIHTSHLKKIHGSDKTTKYKTRSRKYVRKYIRSEYVKVDWLMKICGWNDAINHKPHHHVGGMVAIWFQLQSGFASNATSSPQRRWSRWDAKSDRHGYNSDGFIGVFVGICGMWWSWMEFHGI